MKTMVKTIIILLLFTCLPHLLIAQPTKKILPVAKEGPSRNLISNYSIFNINNLSLRLYSNGHINHNGGDIDAIVYPRGKTGAVFTSSFFWGGRVLDGDSTMPAIRTGGQRYDAATIPGPIVQSGPDPLPGNPNLPVYRIRRDWQTLTGSSLEILRDAADIYGIELSDVTAQQAQQVLADYAYDWNNWPVHLGAPYEDLNGNGSYDRGVDRPGIAEADQVLWTVCNDLDTALTDYNFGCPPIGIELQVTIWGYARPSSALNEMVFKRYRIINKSGFPIDSMFIGEFTDGDIGSFSNDLIGCDTTRNMIYTYNGFSTDPEAEEVGIAPPAFAFSLLQGPIIPSPGDTATTGFDRIPDFKNKSMTSSSNIGSLGQFHYPAFPGEYGITEEQYNLLNGFLPYDWTSPPSPWQIGNGPRRGQTTLYPLSGDPVNTEGDVDSNGDNLAPGDRRHSMHSGPFTMQPGEMQEVIIVAIGGLGGTHLESIIELRENYTVANGLQKSLFQDIPTRVDFKAEVSYLSETFSRIRFRAVNNDASAMRLTLRQPDGLTFAELDLFDDGNHNDGAANDGIWGNDYVVPPYPMGLSADLNVTYDGFDFCWERIGENISTSGPVVVSNFFVGSDNLNRDGVVNPGEDVRYTVEISNSCGFDYTALNLIPFSTPQPETLQNLKIDRQGYPITLDALPANSSYHWLYDSTDFNYLSFQINPAFAGNDSIQLVFRMADTSDNAWLDTLSIFVKPFQNPPQDYLMTKTAGAAEGDLGYRVIDPTALTGDTYEVKFDTFNDTLRPPIELFYNLLNKTTGDTLQTLQDFPTKLTHVGTPVDGYIITRGTVADEDVAGPWEWLGGDRWLGGVNWGGTTFFNSAVFGQRFFGSTITADSAYSEIQIDFDASVTTNANVFRRDIGYAHAGLGTFYGAAYDIEDPANPRRLNIIFVEDDTEKPTDMIWNPDSSANGAREYLLIMDSDYDPIDGGGYTQDAIIFGGVPTQWALWTRIETNHTFLEAPATLNLYITRGVSPGTRYEFTPEYLLGSEEEEQIVNTFMLEQNYPNPFNPETSIRFQIPQTIKTSLTIYNVLGQKVKTLVNNKLSAGSYTMRWSGLNNQGNPVGTGVYFYRIEAGEFVKTRKMLFIK